MGLHYSQGRIRHCCAARQASPRQEKPAASQYPLTEMYSTHAVCIHEWLQGLRGALNAVLFRTGDQSRDFAVVLATNRPGDLDAAILDRMDESLEFGLPGLNERRNILSQYVDQYIVKAGTAEGGAGAGSDTGLWRRFSVSPKLFLVFGFCPNGSQSY